MKILYPAFMRLPTEKAHGLQIMKTCEAFARAGHEVELVVPTRANSLVSEDPFTYYGVERTFTITRLHSLDVIAFGPLGFQASRASFTRGFARYAKGRSADVIFSRDEQVLAPLSRGKTPLVWESHTGSWNASARVVAKAARRLVVLTQSALEYYTQHGADAHKLVVAPDGIDLNAFAHPESREAARSRLGLPLNEKLVFYIGRLDGWKGTKTLFDAAALLGDARVVVIGGEPDQVAQLSEEYPHVRFLGYRPYRELADNQAASDVLVLPNTGSDMVSVRFTSPLKLFSYMASGKPIVASDLPSIREVLNESCAYLVPPDDAQALATGIEAALTDTESAAKATHAHERVEAYTWDARVKKILAKTL